MLAPRLLILWIGLVAPPPDPAGVADAATRLRVVVDRVEVFAEPDDTAFITSTLDRGDEVEVRKALPGGWLAIAAPAGTFHWVEDDAVEILRDGRLYVTLPRTTLRLGREGMPRPGPPRSTLAEGRVLKPGSQEPLAYRDGRRTRTWRSAAVDDDEVRFVRAAGLADPSRSDRPAAVPASAPRPATPERRASHVEADLPPDLVAPLRRVEAEHRGVVARPIEGWDFATVRRDYQALLASHGDPTSRAAIRDRLDQVEREDELAKSAREFVALVRESRRRDGVLEQVRGSIRSLRASEDLAFDAEGMLQASSRRVGGEKVFVLLDDEGQVVTYLKIPPGIDSTNLLARQVGVRGKSRFNESLRFRLLDVRDIEPLTTGR